MTAPSSASAPQTLDDLLWRCANSRPNALAFAHGDERITFGELYEDAGQIAAALLRMGLQPQDRVALLLPSGLDFARVFWAVQRVGAVSCAFNPHVPAEAALRRAARIRPTLIVAPQIDTDFERIAKQHGLRCMEAAALRGAPGTVPRAKIDGESLAFLQPTSGTSGEARAVMIRHRNILAALHAATEGYAMTENDVLLSWVPPWHDLGLVRFMIGAVHLGAACHIVTPAIQTIPRWLQMIGEVGATVTGAPDFAYRLGTRLTDPATVDLSTMRWMVNGGEPVRRSTIEGFETRFGRAGVVCPGYGLAEATLGVTFKRAGEPLRVDERGNVSCGTPLADVEIRVDGDDVGEVLVRGPAVFAGYFDAPSETAEALRDGWLHTGDIGRLDANGELYILGRRKAMLKRGGAVLAPRELEEAAQNVDGVRVAAAVGIARPNDSMTEEIVLALEISSGDVAIAEQCARAAAREVQRAIGFAPESVVVFAPRMIPRTHNGKIRHDALRRHLADGSFEASGAILFRTAVA
jgi:acyl-CoA synthetase (AMP-forming)/AMP-acid ligase II